MHSIFHRIGFCLSLWLVCSGCQKLDVLRFQNSEKEKVDLFQEQELTIDYIGDKAQIVGNTPMVLYGVGLVTGLDNTGEDPPPSNYRTVLTREMKRRGVRNPNEILNQPSTALVLVTGYLLPDVKKGQPFDVQVALPPGSEATSLAGGWLMETYLWEKATGPEGQELTGRAYATAEGPILLSISNEQETKTTALLKRGKILGGGRAKIERELGMFLRSDFKGARNSKRIADRIGERFHYHEQNIKVGMAKAKDDQFIVLKVHPTYKDNYPRYMQVIRNIVFKESLIEERDRLDKLKDQLQNPDTAAVAAIRMEAIGNEAIPFLKTGLNSVSKEVRFYSAEALAYMGNDSGVEVLVETVRTERAFRAYGFAAMAALAAPAPCPSAFVQLRKLLDEESPETRYGAFRALWTMDANDPAIAGRRINDQFNLHLINSPSEPMVHLTRNRVAEVVIYGREQRLNPPLALNAGKKIAINAKPGSDRVVVSKFEVGQKDERKEIENTLVEVVKAASELGATYPDIAGMLIQAKAQHNLAGRLEVDALPGTGRMYYRSKEEQDLANARGGRGKEKATIGRDSLIPNLFPSSETDLKDDQLDPYATQPATAEGETDKPGDAEVGESSSSDVTPASGEKSADAESKTGFTSKIKRLNFLRSSAEKSDAEADSP